MIKLFSRDTHKKDEYCKHILVMVHGNICSSSAWYKLIDEIQRRD